MKTLWLFINTILCINNNYNNYQIGDLTTLYDLIPESTQNVLISNEEEVLSWQPYGNVDNGLLDPASAAMQRKWNEWNSYITTNGNIDSARLLISFGLLPILSSIGNDLHKYVTLNDTEKVIDLLTNPSYKNPIDIDSEKTDGSTSLIIASIMGYTKMVEILLKEGAYTESKSSSGATSLHFAAALNHSHIVNLLLKYNADCNTKHAFAGSTALHFATEMNHDNIIKLLCKSKKCNAEAEKTHGGRSIHIASEANCSNALIALIEDCNVNLESKLLNDTTAMYLAAQYGLTHIIKILIKYGANLDAIMPTISRRDIMSYKNKYSSGSPNIPNPDYDGLYYPDKNLEIGNGATPLHAATENGHYETVKLLLKSGASQLGTMEGTNPVYIGVQYNQYEITKLLLNYDSSNSNINHQLPQNGHSSLYLAVGQNRFKFVKLLLKYGANTNIQTKSGITPIYYSCVRRNDKILNELLKYTLNKNDLKIFIANDDKSNPIHASAKYSCFKCINLLIQFNPSLITTNTNNNENIFHFLFSKQINDKKSIKFINELLSNINNIDDIDITKLLNQKTKNYGLSPFAISIQSNTNIQIIKLLFEKYGADINITANSKQYYSMTPLFIAVQNNNTQIVEYLIKNNANCNVKLSERENITPLFVAADKGFKQIVELLLYKCNNLELTSNEDEYNQNTPIHISCINKHTEIVKIFIKYGITISIMDPKTNIIKELELDQVDTFCAKIHNKYKSNKHKQEL